MIQKFVALLLVVSVLLSCTSCGILAGSRDAEPKIDEMKAICELSVMECYYHNVAKYEDEDAAGILWWQKDKRFWIEYGGVVKLGIDASLVTMEIQDERITITMPEAKVLDCRVDEKELTKDSYVVDKGSAKVTAEDEIKAFEDAQRQLAETAAGDKTLLLGAQNRAKKLLEEYIKNIGSQLGKNYVIDWVYLDAEGTPIENKNSSNDAVSQSVETSTEETIS